MVQTHSLVEQGYRPMHTSFIRQSSKLSKFLLRGQGRCIRNIGFDRFHPRGTFSKYCLAVPYLFWHCCALRSNQKRSFMRAPMVGKYMLSGLTVSRGDLSNSLFNPTQHVEVVRRSSCLLRTRAILMLGEDSLISMAILYTQLYASS